MKSEKRKSTKKEEKKEEKKLTARERKFLEILEDMRRQLIGELRGQVSGSLLVEHESGRDLADEGADLVERSVSLGVLSEEIKKLRMIDEALDRIKHGGFGICMDCGCTIPDARLEAKPYAKLCVKCREKWEELEREGELDEYLHKRSLSEEIME